jgi:hypothetical protein
LALASDGVSEGYWGHAYASKPLSQGFCPLISGVGSLIPPLATSNTKAPLE